MHCFKRWPSLNKITNFLNRFLLAASSPYKFGFLSDHSYLSKAELSNLKGIVESQDLENESAIVNKFEQEFMKLIGSGYGISFASGRMAFYSILRALNIGAGDEVILPGFTCSVMVNAVLRVGAKPVFADIDRDTFGSDASTIEKLIAPKTKVIVAQHSFGIPCNIEPIIALAKKKGLFVVEDCAITLDSSIKGVKVGNFGDAAIFSTDHSKPLNTIVGGLFYTTNKEFFAKVKKLTKDIPSLDKQHQLAIYEQMLFERKYSTPSSHFKLFLLSTLRARIKKTQTYLRDDFRMPALSEHSYPYPSRLPGFLAQLGLYELNKWKDEKVMRKRILASYLAAMNEVRMSKYIPKAYLNYEIDITPLRFAFYCPDAEKVKKTMSKHFEISWIWFQQPIICCLDGVESFGYKNGSCLLSEDIGEHILNFPCNVNVAWEKELIKSFKNIFNSLTEK